MPSHLVTSYRPHRHATAGCRQSTRSKYYKSTRHSPPFPANECCGRIMRGNDGRMYESRRATSGDCRWQAYHPGRKTKAKKTTKKAKKNKKAKKSKHEPRRGSKRKTKKRHGSKKTRGAKKTKKEKRHKSKRHGSKKEKRHGSRKAR
jgi:hypothetical protein